MRLSSERWTHPNEKDRKYMEFNLAEVDVDGAIRDAHEEVSGDTRLGFMKKAGIGAGAFLSGGAVLAALAPAALAAGAPPASPFGAGDIGILNYALTLEYLESTFYNTAAKNGIVKASQLKTILATTQKDENNHVAFLKKALGSKAIGKPSFDFGKAVTDEATLAATAYVLENTGVEAYSGQALNIKSAAYAAAALSIWAVEARHAGAIGLYLGKPIAATGSFQTGATAKTVLAAVTATKFVTKL
jgi:rubrerythrin